MRGTNGALTEHTNAQTGVHQPLGFRMQVEIYAVRSCLFEPLWNRKPSIKALVGVAVWSIEDA